MPNLPSNPLATMYPLASYTFAQSQSGANQSAVALKLNVNTATNGSLNITGVAMPFAGSIVGVTANLTANKTAGSMTLTPTINGTALSAPAVLVNVAVANSASKKVTMTDAQQTGARFAAGDLVGVKLTTDGSYAPTTNDLYVTVYAVFDGVQF